MSMIVLVAAERGGTGKSTITSNIAVYLVRQNVDVILIGTDGQAACAQFSERRNEAGIGPTIPCIQRTGDTATTLHDLSRRYQVTVIDANGRDSREMRSTMTISNLLLVLTRTSRTDLETLPKINELVSLARSLNPDLKAFAVLSMVSSSPAIREVDNTREALSQLGQLELADTIICDRKVYRDVLLNGNGVVGLSSSQVYAEIQLPAQEFFEVVT